MKKVTLLLAIPFLLNACVTKKKYDTLLNQNSNLSENLNKSNAKNVNLNNRILNLNESNQKLRDQIISYKADVLELNSKIKLKTQELNAQKEFQTSYLKNSQLKQNELVQEINKRNKQLTDKEKALSNREAKLAQLKLDLDELKSNLSKKTAEIKKREDKINLLQAQINQRDSMLSSLKSSISVALNSFKDQGLTVSEKDGKIYIQMKDNLLFQTASIVVGKKGKDALVQLASVLNNKQNIDIMIEGHTDNVPMQTAQIKDNWDLSVLRATSIIRILTKEGKVNPKRIVAAGKSEFSPIDIANTKEARKKNRRTEIIVIPNMQQFYSLLNQ